MDTVCRIELKAARKGRLGSSVQQIYDRFGSVHDVAIVMTGNIDKTLQDFNRNGFNYKVTRIPNTNWSFLIISKEDYKCEEHFKIISEVVLNTCCKPDHIEDLNAFYKWRHDRNTTEGYFRGIIHNQFRLEGHKMVTSREVYAKNTIKRADIFPRLPCSC